MRTSAVLTPLVSLLTLHHAAAQSSMTPGYTPVAPTIPTNDTTFSFGPNVAILNLDLITALVGSVASTPAGSTWISSVASWIDYVHSFKDPPLQIFTRIYLNPGHPEVSPTSPFYKVVAQLINITETSPEGQLYKDFHANPAGYANGTTKDVVLQKTRYSAAYSNEMVEILRAQKIDTVVMSGIRTSGVILSTAYDLYDLDFNVYVIMNNTIETPPDNGIDAAILGGILPKMPVNVITIDQARAALKRSIKNGTQTAQMA